MQQDTWLNLLGFVFQDPYMLLEEDYRSRSLQFKFTINAFKALCVSNAHWTGEQFPQRDIAQKYEAFLIEVYAKTRIKDYRQTFHANNIFLFREGVQVVALLIQENPLDDSEVCHLSRKGDEVLHQLNTNFLEYLSFLIYKPSAFLSQEKATYIVHSILLETVPWYWDALIKTLSLEQYNQLIRQTLLVHYDWETTHVFDKRHCPDFLKLRFSISFAKMYPWIYQSLLSP